MNVMSVRCGLGVSLCTRAEMDLGLGNGNPVMLVLIDLIPLNTENKRISSGHRQIAKSYIRSRFDMIIFSGGGGDQYSIFEKENRDSILKSTDMSVENVNF